MKIFKWPKQYSSSLFGLLLISNLYLFITMWRLQSDHQNLVNKFDQSETESNIKCPNAKSHIATVKSMEKIEERLKDASERIDDIVRSLETRRKYFEKLEIKITKMNETLNKENTYLNFVVEKIETVKSEQDLVIAIQGDIEIVRRSAENCLSLKAYRITKMNFKMEKLNKNAIVLHQKHSRFSRNLQKLNTKLTEETNLLDMNSIEVTELKSVTVQLKLTSRKLDDTLVIIGTSVTYYSEIVEKCKVILSADMEDIWLLVHTIAGALVIIICAHLMRPDS